MCVSRIYIYIGVFCNFYCESKTSNILILILFIIKSIIVLFPCGEEPINTNLALIH